MTEPRCAKGASSPPPSIARPGMRTRAAARCDPRIISGRLTYRCPVACDAGLRSEPFLRDRAMAVDVASSIKTFAVASDADVPASAAAVARGRRCPRGARPIGARPRGGEGSGASVGRALEHRVRVHQKRACTERASTERACTERAWPRVRGRACVAGAAGAWGRAAPGCAGSRAALGALSNEALSFGTGLLCRTYMPEGRARQAFHACCVAMACQTRVCDASGASRAGVHTVIVALLSTF